MVSQLRGSEQFERTWLAQLQLEHSLISRQCRLQIATPLFELTNSSDKLGSYESGRWVCG